MEIYSEGQQSLATLLEVASREGEVRIQRADGQVFVLKPERAVRSALDVAGINLNISTEEIVEFVREGRDRARIG
jgi:hypothetical protein